MTPEELAQLHEHDIPMNTCPCCGKAEPMTEWDVAYDLDTEICLDCSWGNWDAD
jgi:hypothetical protein